MRYVSEKAAADAKLDLSVGSIHKSGSVTGMQQNYGWQRGGQVRVGSYIYNVGVQEVERLRRLNLLRGES